MKKLLLPLLLSVPIAVFGQLTTTVTKTDITCFGDSNGTATVNGGIAGASEPIMISEVNVNTPDFIELTNVSGNTVNTDGWFVITSNSYSNINTANSLAWDLPSSVAAGWIDYREDQSGSNYWGNNLFYSSGNAGWVLLSDDQGNIVDFVAWGWSESEILNSFNVSHSGFTFNISTEWSGAGESATCSSSFIRTGNEDNDDATDWSCGTTSKGSLNSGLSLPFLGGIGINYEWSTGDTTNHIDSLGPGTYYVTTTSAAGDTAFDTVTIIEPPIPSFTLPGDTLLCDGEALLLDAGAGWDTYTWSHGPQAQNLLLTDPGMYVCTVTDTNGCPAVDSIEIIGGEAPDIDLGNDTSICDTTYILDVGNAGVSYSWSNGSNAPNTMITETGTYSVTVTSGDGCTAEEDIYVEMNPPAIVDLGEDFVLCYNYNHTQLLNAGAQFDSYMWNTGATSTTLLVGSGITSPQQVEYSVIVVNEYGCTGMDTVVVTYEQCTGVNDEMGEGLSLQVFPNPTQGQLAISAEEGRIESVSVIDLTGKEVARKANATASTRVDLSLMDVAPGSYVLKVMVDGQATYSRIIVN